MALNNPRFLCRPPIPYAPELLKAALDVSVADEWALDGPEDLAHGTMDQTGFYTHRGLDDWTSSDGPGGPLTPDTPPRSRPQEHGWTRGFGRGNWQSSLEDALSRLTLRLDQGFAACLSLFVERPT